MSGIAVYEPSDLQQDGVIIFYEAENTQMYTTHRAVGETDCEFITQGDALAATDHSMGRSYV